MTRKEAFARAKGNANAFLVADFRFLAGRGKRPDPAFYGISGTIEKPGNTLQIGDFTFALADLVDGQTYNAD